MTLAWLQDRDDVRVRAALERTCSICRSAPGVVCRHPWVTSVGLGRVVHLCRVQAHMDKQVIAR